MRSREGKTGKGWHPAVKRALAGMKCGAEPVLSTQSTCSINIVMITMPLTIFDGEYQIEKHFQTNLCGF